MIGTTLSHYRITEKLGAGGMGVVYRAEDTNLNRQVAIKVLPEMFIGDPERMARFEREAKLLASLNHPNIATIYGLEQADGKRFLVMELVEGETLAQRIAKGPLPVDETLDICRQIAEGLEAAHEKGIIHRDLKPANVKITPEGKVKVLDFGLAKAFQEEPSAAEATHSPTLTDQMTRPGVILGTAAYMAPEQAKGKAVDKRADIWAFGCILYECLSGKRAFEGETVTETLAAILKGEPDWHSLPAATPWNMTVLLRGCLQKDPKERLHDIADVRIEIKEPMIQAAAAVTSPRRFSLLWLASCAAVTLLGGIIIGWVLMEQFQRVPSASVVRSTIKIEPGHCLDGIRSKWEMQRPTRTAMAISGDGRFVVYSAIEENPGPQAKPQLYVRRLEKAEAKPIPGTEGGINPFLSPDNRFIGFWADGKLKRVPVEGGVPTPLCKASSLFGANWGRDGSIVFADSSSPGLSIVSAEGGEVEILTKPDPRREESSHLLPFWLPNGKGVLFTVVRHIWDRHPWLALLRRDTGQWHVLLEDAADARYLPTGHLVFLQEGTLFAVGFDLGRLEAVGQPVALVEHIMQAFSESGNNNTCAGQFSISDTGTLVYVAGGIAPDRKDSLVWVDQKGVEQPVTAWQQAFQAARLSPDGRRIACTTTGEERQVWIYDLDRDTPIRLTSEGIATRPSWTPDGKRIIFGWRKSLISNLFWQPYDGSSQMERFTTSEYEQIAGPWASDGVTVALAELRPNTGWDIFLQDTRSRRQTPFLNSEFQETCPEFSPDGRWMAYSSDESVRNEVYVTDFPRHGVKFPVSTGGGTEPLWARNGKLFYRGEDQVWVVDVRTRTDGGLAISKAEELFKGSGYALGSRMREYDLSPDEQRFLMIKVEQRQPQLVTEMILVQNWFEELKRLVPTGKK